jgi:hypothetical protein
MSTEAKHQEQTAASAIPADAQTCPNCSTRLVGQYCYHCGQERFGRNLFKVRNYVKYMGDELFDFDSKNVRTLRYLILRPGFLTREYWEGKIKRYIVPFKLYLFVAFLFYIVIVFINPADLQSYREVVEGYNERIEQAIAASSLTEAHFEDKFNGTISGLQPFYVLGCMFLFAGALALFYPKPKRYYVQHFIFAAHFLTFYLINDIVFGYWVNRYDVVAWLYLGVQFAYLLIALRTAYQQSWGTSVAKAIGLWFVVLGLYLTYYFGGFEIALEFIRL